jgi:ribonuclease P protein component
LRQKSHFERLLQHGMRRTLDGYTFYIGKRERGGARLGLLVTRRHAARANVRNYLKRCIREAFRLEQHNLGAVDLLVRPPFGAVPSSDMVLRLRELLGKIGT